MPNTPLLNFPYPDSSQDPDVPRDIQALAQAVEDEVSPVTQTQFTYLAYSGPATVAQGSTGSHIGYNLVRGDTLGAATYDTVGPWFYAEIPTDGFYWVTAAMACDLEAGGWQFIQVKRSTDGGATFSPWGHKAGEPSINNGGSINGIQVIAPGFFNAGDRLEAWTGSDSGGRSFNSNFNLTETNLIVVRMGS